MAEQLFTYFAVLFQQTAMSLSSEQKKIQELIASNKTRQAIQRLKSLANRWKDSDLGNQVALVSGQFEDLSNSRIAGIISEEQYNPALSEIHKALGEIVLRLPSEKYWRNWLKVGILSAVLLLLAFLLFQWSKSIYSSSNSVTILVHGPGGLDDEDLPNGGEVTLIYGDAIVRKSINSEREATFKQINNAFFESGARVQIIFSDPQGEPYKAVRSDSLYQLIKGQYISLEVRLENLDQIRGHVEDFVTGMAIAGVRISVQGKETFTDEFGEFLLLIPQDKQQKYQTIRAFKSGYEDYEKSGITPQTREEVVIPMRRLK